MEHVKAISDDHRALTAFSLTCAYLGRGLLRGHGVLIICGYLAFAGVVLAVAYASRRGLVLSIAIPAACGIPLAGWLLHNSHGRIRAGEPTEGREATRDQPLDQATRATMPPPHG